MITKTTTCSRDCPDVCTLQVEVSPEGRAVKLRGSAEDPITRGFLCERTSRFLSRQYDESRFTRPMWRPRKGAELEPVSWEFALDLCAKRMQAIPKECILHFRSGGSMGILKQLSDLLFERFGPVTVKRGDICSGAGEAAQEADFGLCDSHDHLDLAHSKNIVLWGKNLHTSSPHLLPWLMELKQKGARLIGIDPVRTRQAGIVDLFVQPNPGTDFALVMAIVAAGGWKPGDFCDFGPEFMAMVQSRSDWADICGVSGEDIAALVEVFQNGPTSIQVGWGMGRRAYGGATIRALDALAAVSGNLGIPGGGCSYYYQRRVAFGSAGGQGLIARSLSEARLGEEILAADPPIQFAWITAANPISMLPDSNTVRQALLSVETVVVVETHPTDTTDVADLVLPTLTLLEDDDLLGAYGNHYLRVSQPVVEPPGEARHELWIWQQMAQRLGVNGLEGSPREWKERLMGRLHGAGIGLADLERGPVRNPFAPMVLFEGLRFPTATGKMQLVHQAPEFPSPDPEYPLQLAAFAIPKAQASQWAIAEPSQPEARVHPGCPVPPGPAVVETRQGRLPVLLVHDDRVHPRQVLLAKGGTLRGGGCPNQLIRARETDIGGGANYYEEPARVLPA